MRSSSIESPWKVESSGAKDKDHMELEELDSDSSVGGDVATVAVIVPPTADPTLSNCDVRPLTLEGSVETFVSTLAFAFAVSTEATVPPSSVPKLLSFVLSPESVI